MADLRTCIKSVKSLALVGAMAVGLAACGAHFKGEVATFHALPSEGLGGKRVSLVPAKEEYAKSLEYAHYAGVISRELVRGGFADAGTGEADLMVAFDVKISDGREKFYNRPAVNAGVGFGPGFGWGWGGGFGWGFGGGFQQNELRARTVYHVELSVQMRTPDGNPVWEGRVESDVRGNSLPDNVPLMARAIFKEFPGKSGTSRLIVLKEEDLQDLLAEGR